MNDCQNCAPNVAIIGAGLAGCECARVLARAGVHVTLFEMKPHKFSPAHTMPELAELVCSNSFRSDDPDSGVGELKQEMRQLGSIVMEIAAKTSVPAGKALAVDRTLFSQQMSAAIESEENITLVRQEIHSFADEALQGFTHIVLAAGPLASEEISHNLSELLGTEHLYFYDAIAPIINADSVNIDIAYWGSRYNPDDDDYLNCPFTKEEYQTFYDALIAGEKAPTKEFEKEVHFEGCMPIEALAERGFKTLVFGPMKPVGLDNPRTGRWPFAVLQLRTENQNKSMFNLVGCQTKLKYPEQERIFRLIPGLEQAEFVRFGSMHRNTYVNAPKVLNADLSLKAAPHIFLAGQISGVEGYVESAACGLWLGHLLAARLTKGRELPLPPQETGLGALMNHLRTEAKHFQPSNVNYGLSPELGERAHKKDRKAIYSERARTHFAEWLSKINEA